MSLPVPTDVIAKFFIGLCGAAYTLYANLGGALPGMGESTEIKNLSEDILDLQEKVYDSEDKLKGEEVKLTKGEISVAQFTVMERSINNQRDDWGKEITALRANRSELKRNYYLQGAITYVFLGGFFAAILAEGAIMKGTDPNVQAILTAVFIGAGWTSVISRYMQKGEYKEIKNDLNNKLIDIKEEYDEILSDKEKEYKENLEKANKDTLELTEICEEYVDKYTEASKSFKDALKAAKNETLEIAKEYDEIVKILQDKAKEGEALLEKFNEFKEANKDNPIFEKLTEIGFPL